MVAGFVEVFLPSTPLREKRDKFDLYQRFSVNEVRMIDLEAKYIEVFRLEEGHFRRQGVYDPFISAVLGDKTVECSPILT